MNQLPEDMQRFLKEEYTTPEFATNGFKWRDVSQMMAIKGPRIGVAQRDVLWMDASFVWKYHTALKRYELLYKSYATQKTWSFVPLDTADNLTELMLKITDANHGILWKQLSIALQKDCCRQQPDPVPQLAKNDLGDVVLKPEKVNKRFCCF